MADESNGKMNSKIYRRIPNIKFTKLFIDGDFVDSISGKTFETVDPSLEEVIAKIAEGDKEDVDLAVKAARQAFDLGSWPRMPGCTRGGLLLDVTESLSGDVSDVLGAVYRLSKEMGTGYYGSSERGKIMNKFADLIDENLEELATLETIDVGKVFSFETNVDIPSISKELRYFAGAADKIHGKTLKLSSEFQGYTLLEPIGVVGHIIPWNFPSAMFVLKCAPALAAGCTMVIKPAEQAPLSALYLAHLAKHAGIPNGVINVVTGFGHTAGSAIASHMDIDCVSFTGSTEVGRLVMQAAATSNLKVVSLELGGKSPLLIFDDADVDKAADLALFGSLANKGEICVCSSRVFVQEGLYDKLVEKVVEKVKMWVVGDPFDPSTRQGPQVDKNQYERVLSYINQGKREGASILVGGKPCGEKGYYIEPTIFENVTDDMLIAKDEIFGPVMSLMKFKTIEEAIERANATTYGLAAGIVTNDLNIANRVSRSIRAGVIWINCYHNFDSGCPIGGYKMSGFGKDHGIESLEKYLQTKAVVTPIYNSPWL